MISRETGQEGRAAETSGRFIQVFIQALPKMRFAIGRGAKRDCAAVDRQCAVYALATGRFSATIAGTIVRGRPR